MTFSRVRRVVVIFALAGVVAALYYRRLNPAPCSRPILYSIGTVDPRFNVTSQTLIDDSKIAIAIWNRAAGHTVLAYDPAAPLTINLIYDARQSNATLGVSLSEKQAGLDSARDALDASQRRYIAIQDVYNSDVTITNNKGGATPDESAALQARKAALDALADTVRGEEARFNASIAAVNSQVENFNQQAGQILKAGEYVRDARGRRINVFKFIGDTELERFLAHEFGHAIGLDHNGDPESIMYAQSENGNLTPTAADLAALRAACGGSR
jgi:hypothetical protein